MGRFNRGRRLAEEGGGVMAGAKKWNMVIDVARCMDCNDCFLADKDEFTGQRFPALLGGPALGRPPLDEHHADRTGPVPAGAGRLPAHALPSLRRRALHEGLAGGDRLQTRRRAGDHRPGEGEGPSGDRRHLPLRGHLLERRGPGGAEVHRLRPPASTKAGWRPAARRCAPPKPSSWFSPTMPRWRPRRPPRASRCSSPSWAPSRGSTTRTCICSTRRSSPATWCSATRTSALRAPRRP